MGRVEGALIVGAGVAGLLLLSAARSPEAVTPATPGLWEISGFPTAGTAARQCLANTATLARLEHRGQNCTERVISHTPTSKLIHYTCANGGYGQTKLTMLTPRSLRIETQGISAGYPFNYVIQARRVANCDAH